VSDKKASILRLAQPEKAEFAFANEHFYGKRNEKIDIFLLTLVRFVAD
jgi:hypothetical protein